MPVNPDSKRIHVGTWIHRLLSNAEKAIENQDHDTASSLRNQVEIIFEVHRRYGVGEYIVVKDEELIQIAPRDTVDTEPKSVIQ